MCGIWGIVNQEEEAFDYQSFCTLGCANDRRGGDSCGVFIDGKVEYGIDKRSHFEDFFWKSELLNNTKTAKIALGHDRKASVGGISLEKAHPIIIYESVPVAEGEEPREEVKFVLVHNGTIHNYEDLAKKYIPDIDIKGMSDSQVLARLLYYSGFDFLAEYNGGAAFIAVDYRGEKPEVILWKGESKQSSYFTTVEEERPLFVNTDNGRLVVSSIASYLAIVDGECYQIPGNEVLKYADGQLWIVKKIDRSKAQQKPEYKYNDNTYAYRGTATTYTEHEYLHGIDYNNTYKIGQAIADGFVRVTSFGKVLRKNETPTATEKAHQIWFFNGIPLVNARAFVFLCKALKRTKMTAEQFTSMYQNFIRYFSYNRCYFAEGKCFEANEPFSRIPYTGYYQLLSNANADYYEIGVKTNINRITTVHDGFEFLNKEPEFDYKTIWKRFIQSMP